jgi:hypothetical protein
VINGWYNTIHHPRDEDLTVHRLEGLKASKDRNAIFCDASKKNSKLNLIESKCQAMRMFSLKR